MSKTETVEVALRLPKSVSDFYSAYAESTNQVFENLLVEELISDIEMHLDIEPNMRNLIIHQYGLEELVKTK